MFQGMIDTGAAALRALLATTVPARQEAAPSEPELPDVRADGVLAALAR